MEIIIQKDEKTASLAAAELVASTLESKSDSVIGFATGSTPLMLYKELIRMHKEEGLDFSRATAFMLDEYLGLEKGHPSSFDTFIRENLFNLINLPEENINVPNCSLTDHLEKCRQYDDAIEEAGGIDLQILGIGTDGHIGFNEPISSFASRTRLKTLAVQTRKDNARFFSSPEEVPMHVVTMGIGSIVQSKVCVLLAFGKNKADIIAKTVEGPVTAEIPATALHFHQHTKIVIDQAAASKLKHADYYKYVYTNKPAK